MMAARMLARSLATLVAGLLMLALTSERGAVIAGIAACIAALGGWEYWHWRGRR
jgi:hypothetical protein